MLFRRISLPLLLAGFVLTLQACAQAPQEPLDEEEEIEQEIDLEELCGDGADNDKNGLIDCDDPACDEDPFCAPRPEECNNGVDDDRDGLTDCEDPDCAQTTACQCEDSNAVFVDRQTSLTLAGTTEGSLDLSNLGCQLPGSPEVLFVLHPVETTRLRIRVVSNQDMVLGVEEGACDNLPGFGFTCVNRAFAGEVEEHTIDAQAGRPVLLFVGGARPDQQGAFFLNLTAI